MPRPSAFWAPLTVVALALAACGGAPLRAAKRGPGRPIDVGPRPEGSADAAMPPPALPVVKKIAAAEGHTCAVLASGRVACWGAELGPIDSSRHGTNVTRPRVVEGVSDAVDVATGERSACALTRAGEVLCWAGSYSDEFFPSAETPPHKVPGLEGVVALSARRGVACGLRRDGHVLCWNPGPLRKPAEGAPGELPGITDAAQVALGETRTCVRRAGGTVLCWGTPLRGTGNEIAFERAETFPEVSDAIDVSISWGRTCVVRASGEVVCLSPASSSRPSGLKAAPVRPLVMATDATHVALGHDFECALKRNGRITCWGSNEWGQLGDGTSQPHHEPLLVGDLDDATQIVAGSEHACALRKTGAIACWGSNVDGQLGLGTDHDVGPTRVAGVTASKVAVGLGQSCAIEGGKLLCWGAVASPAPAQRRSTPVAVPGLDDVRDVALAGRNACAVIGSGEVYCWKVPESPYFEFGVQQADPPKRVPKLTDATAVALNASYSCALRRGGKVSCWGLRELPDRPAVAFTPNAEEMPGVAFNPNAEEVPGVEGAVELSVGGGHICARLVSGGVRCWGKNRYGQLGAPSTQRGLAPEYSKRALAVAPFAGRVTALGAGSLHTCALLEGGAVTCWGTQTEHHERPLGRSPPRFVAVPGVNDAKALRVVDGRSCVVRERGRVSCWSRLVDDQIDLADLRVPALSSIAFGEGHGCGVAEGGAVHCWGDNGAGQAGAPPPYRPTPVVPAW